MAQTFHRDKHAGSRNDSAIRPAAVTAFDLKKLSPEFLENPYPTYRALREHDPVHRMPRFGGSRCAWAADAASAIHGAVYLRP